MRRLLKAPLPMLLLLLITGLPTVSCVELGAAPDDSGSNVDRALPFALVSKEPTAVLQAESAPPLETTVQSFWIVKGESSEIEIKYAPPGESLEDFLDVEFGEEALLAHPDGTPIAEGESVLITLTVHPSKFQVSFEPSGLQIDPDHPVVIEFKYEHADHDFDRDGDMDEADEQIRVEELGIWKRAAPGQVWTETESDHDTLDQKIKTEVWSLENIAVSW